MVTQAIGFASFTPSRLSRYYYVYEKGENELFLRLDVSRIFSTGAKWPIEFSYDESVLEILEAVELYERASFFKRWYLRITTPIKTLQHKLFLVSEYMAESHPMLPGLEPNTLMGRLINRAHHSQKQKSTIFSYIVNNVKNIWQGVVGFMRKARTFLSSFSKKIYDPIKIQLEGNTCQRDLLELYAKAMANFEDRYFNEVFSQHGPQSSMQTILEQIENYIAFRREEVRQPLSMRHRWRGNAALSESQAREKIATLNRRLDALEGEGQAEFTHIKAKIYLFEVLRESFTQLQKDTRKTIHSILQRKADTEETLETLLHYREKTAALSRQMILFSNDARILQRHYGVSPQLLVALFIPMALGLDELFHRPIRMLVKKHRAEFPLESQQKIYAQYKDLLHAMQNILIEGNSDLVKERQAEIYADYQQFLKTLEETAGGLYPEYPAKSLSIWNRRMKAAYEAVNQWRVLLRKQAHYEVFFNQLESLSTFLGVAPSAAHYRFLAEAHAQGLRKRLRGCKNAHLATLSDRAEKCIENFQRRLKESEARFRVQFPERPSENSAEKSGEYARLSAEIYQQISVQFSQTLLQRFEEGETIFLPFAEKAKFHFETLLPQFEEALSDLAENAEQKQASRKIFEENMSHSKSFMEQLFSDIQSHSYAPLHFGGGITTTFSHSDEAWQAVNIQTQNQLFQHLQKKLWDITYPMNMLDLKSLLHSLATENVNSYLLLQTENHYSFGDLRALKSEVHQYMQVSLLSQLEMVLPALKNLFSRLQTEGISHWQCALKEGVLFSEAIFFEPFLLEWVREEEYFKMHFRAFRQNLALELQRAREALEKAAPDLSSFIDQCLNSLQAELRTTQLEAQENLLLTYYKKPQTFVSLALDSELAVWIREAIGGYIRDLAWELIQFMNEHSSGELEYARRRRSFNQESLCQHFYERLRSKTPLVQLQAMLYAQQEWQQGNRLDEDRHLELMIRVWRVLQVGALWLDSGEWLKENEACLQLFKELLEKQSDFWQNNCQDDVATLNRLLRWQRNALNRTLQMDGKEAKAELEKLQKRVKKIFHLFLLVYHPDKHSDKKEKAWTTLDQEQLPILRQEVETLVELCNQPVDVKKPQTFVDPLEATMAELLQNVFEARTGSAALGQKIAEQGRELTELKIWQTEFKEKIVALNDELADNGAMFADTTAMLAAQMERMDRLEAKMSALGLDMDQRQKCDKSREKSENKGQELSEDSGLTSVPEITKIQLTRPRAKSPSLRAESARYSPQFFQAEKSSSPSPEEPNSTLSSAPESPSPEL